MFATSSNGKLDLTLYFRSQLTSAGVQRYCYMTDLSTTAIESPILVLHPGDTLTLTIKNDVVAHGTSTGFGTYAPVACGALPEPSATTATNVHFHGLQVAPECPGDEVIKSVFNAQQQFTYTVSLPSYAEPGLYWYHPHHHGLAEKQVQGGATGVIIVEGMENVQPAVAGLRERVIVVRDAAPTVTVIENRGPGLTFQLEVNNIQVYLPNLAAPTYTMQAGTPEFWRLANTASDTFLNVSLIVNDAPWTLGLVARDAFAIRRMVKGKVVPTVMNVTSIFLSPGGRAEFIVIPPPTNATFITNYIPGAFWHDVTRPLFQVAVLEEASAPGRIMPATTSSICETAPLLGVRPSGTNNHTITFSQQVPNFYMTVDQQTPQVFNPSNPPSINVTQGSVQQWTIVNQVTEIHAYHLHALHATVQSSNFLDPVSFNQYVDTIAVAAWSGSGPYPYVVLNIDFTGADVGTTVHHCHILDHEDGGMMAAFAVNVVHDTARSGRGRSGSARRAPAVTCRPRSGSVSRP
jgi:FtsP/CotA-like multicopper oxidase with cupredoxin domain